MKVLCTLPLEKMYVFFVAFKTFVFYNCQRWPQLLEIVLNERILYKHVKWQFYHVWLSLRSYVPLWSRWKKVWSPLKLPIPVVSSRYYCTVKVTQGYTGLNGSMSQGKLSVQTHLNSATTQANPVSPTCNKASQRNKMGDILTVFSKMISTMNKVVSDVSTMKFDKNKTHKHSKCFANTAWRCGKLYFWSGKASVMNEKNVLRKRVEQLWSFVDAQENQGRR